MEEKIKYKKCPYCELNYIPATDVCCRVCYRTSQIARQESISQRNRKYELRRIKERQQQEIIRQKELELQRIQECENKKELLAIWKNFNFIGFLHTANFDNFVNIYKSKFLKSRKQLMSEGIVFEDNAEFTVLEKTLESVKSKVRFYYRPITPTNISAYMWHNQKNPVLIVFDENLIFEREVLFCDGCAGSNLTTSTKTAKDALRFNWKEIFSIGPFNTDDFVLKNHRNAEFLTNSQIPLERAIKFYFRNYKDYVNACELFGSDVRFEHNPKMFY